MTPPTPARPRSGSVLVTGVSRRVGIAYAIAGQLVADGWDVGATGWPAHDASQPWGADPAGPPDGELDWTAADLAEPDAPRRLVDRQVRRHGRLDALVACHARSSDGVLGELDATELDLALAVNARATVLLTQEAVRAGASRVVLFTTGVHRGPMADEIPYALSKAALQGVTATLAASVAPTGTTVNCVNPGPVDTGYADEATRAEVARRMPRGRWGTPADVVPLVRWLLSADAGWVTGQTIDADGGWGAGH